VQEELVCITASGALFVPSLRCLYDYTALQDVLPNASFSKIPRITKPYPKEETTVSHAMKPRCVHISRLECDANVVRQNPANPQMVALYPLRTIPIPRYILPLAALRVIMVYLLNTIRIGILIR